jgi:hypothetical protein
VQDSSLLLGKPSPSSAHNGYPHPFCARNQSGLGRSSSSTKQRGIEYGSGDAYPMTSVLGPETSNAATSLAASSAPTHTLVPNQQAPAEEGLFLISPRQSIHKPSVVKMAVSISATSAATTTVSTATSSLDLGQMREACQTASGRWVCQALAQGVAAETQVGHDNKIPMRCRSLRPWPAWI